jgi:hypothetical protein
MDFKEIGWEAVDWIHLAKDRDHWQALMNMVIHLLVSYNAGSFLSS